MKLLDLKQQHKEALDTAEAALGSRDHVMTTAETEIYDQAMSKASALSATIKRREGMSTIRSAFPGGMPGFEAPVGLTNRGTFNAAPAHRGAPLSEDYTQAFMSLLQSGGKRMSGDLGEGFDPLFGGYAMPALPGISAATYEGSNAAGGYAATLPTDNLIVPLAVPDLGVRSIARAMPTNSDILIPSQSTFGTAGVKAESGASANLFAESDPTLGQLRLSAFMVGLTSTASWELLQDVQIFQEFLVRDLLNAVDIWEDNMFVNGSGTSQPQGLLGNVATGTAAPYLYESTGAYLLNAIDDVLGTLKGVYFPNASWLMSRATGVAIRRAQRQANLFAPVWTRENGRDMLHGYPVSYSSSMPAIPTATTAGVQSILFGSFQDGYIIGDRGGAGTFVKVLDQPAATAGQTIFLGYKRVDGRVRRSEAIQAISISHS